MENILLFALVAIATPAAAFPETDMQTITVSFNAADLATPDARAKLEKRVRHAVRKVCDVRGPASIDAKNRVAACTGQAWKDAARQMELAFGAPMGGSHERLGR